MKFYNLKKHTKTRKALRNNTPPAELILWTHLKRKRFRGLKFRRQYGIDRHVVDFYCPKLRLAIEVDGINHLGKKQKLKDQKLQQKQVQGNIIHRVENLLCNYESNYNNVNIEDISQQLGMTNM